MTRFQGKTALVSGGFGTIGLAIGARLAREGANVVLADIAQNPPARVQEMAAAHVSLDVTSEDDWAKATAFAVDRYGSLDVLVNNAGILNKASQLFDELKLDEWRQLFAVNVDGVLLGTQAGMRSMKVQGGGSIVNIASIAGYVGSKDNGSYGASKGAVRSLTKQAALSAAQAGYGVRVNAVHPGFVWTPLIEAKAVGRFGSVEAAQTAFRGMNPLNRIVGPDDVAAAVAFLASDDAAMITGADLVVDGGRLIQ